MFQIEVAPTVDEVLATTKGDLYTFITQASEGGHEIVSDKSLKVIALNREDGMKCVALLRCDPNDDSLPFGIFIFDEGDYEIIQRAKAVDVQQLNRLASGKITYHASSRTLDVFREQMKLSVNFLLSSRTELIVDRIIPMHTTHSLQFRTELLRDGVNLESLLAVLNLKREDFTHS